MDRIDAVIVTSVVSVAFAVWPAGDTAEAKPGACVCPDIRPMQAQMMADRDRERAAHRLGPDRPEAKKPPRPDDED